MIWIKTIKSNYDWHKWFAWRPIAVESVRVPEKGYIETTAWLETIERRLVGSYGGDYWEYRLPKKGGA